MMTKRFSLVLVMLVALTALVLSASAAKNVTQGQDVFIGEQGLDLVDIAANSATVVWYNPGDAIGSNPAATKTINTRDFYVAPADYVGRTGTWYLQGTTTSAFVVNDPSLEVKIWDQNAAKDVTGKSIPAGNTLNFRIETNMYTLSQRTDFATTLNDIRIKVKTSDGTVYDSLFNSTTNATSLVGLKVNAQPYYWVAANNPAFGWKSDVLDTQGNRMYKAGTYTVWAESNVNKMKDNYKDPSGADYTGKTISATRTVTIASDTVKIEASKDSVVRGNPFSVTVTGRPNTAYYLWVKGTSSMTGGTTDQPPQVVRDQDSVAQDSPAGTQSGIGDYQFEGGAGKTIKNDTPKEPLGGTVYYARVTLSNSGTRTVGFSTSKDTKDKKYTIRVERSESILGGSIQFKSDEVDVKVEKGAVTVVAAGDQSYFLGEEIKLSGTNSETDNVYLFITGPNLPTAGGKLTSPRESVTDKDASSFTLADVLEDNTWEYKWQTANLNIDAGTYTVYAVATPNNRDNLANTQYGTVSIIVRKPFVSATASQSVVASGDKLFLSGTAEGKPSQGIAVWILGKNFAAYTTESVNADSTFSHEVTDAQTRNMASGQYFVVIQHPMYNDNFDVYPGSGSSTGFVVGTYPVAGNKLFALTGAGSLQGSDAANALVEALNNPSVDDTYTKLQFLVEVPTIRINPVGEKSVGAKFNIEGTTNLAVDDEILVEVTSSSFKPTDKTQSGEFSGSTGTVKVQKGTDGFNTFTFPVDAASFKPDEYIVKASGITVDATATTLFNVVAFTATPTPTKTPTPSNTTRPITTVATTIPPTTVKPTTTSPGFGALIALIGLGAVAFLVVRALNGENLIFFVFS